MRFSLSVTFLLLAAPFFSEARAAPLQVEWVTPDNSAVRVRSLLERRDSFEQCLNGGLALEHRFLVRLCEDAPGWYSECTSERKIIHQLERDPIQGTYTVWRDRLGDREDPLREIFEEYSEAKTAFLETISTPLTFLDAGSLDPYRFLEVKSIVRCKGEYGDFLRHFSYLFSFGLIDLDGSDTGWIAFEIE